MKSEEKVLRLGPDGGRGSTKCVDGQESKVASRRRGQETPREDTARIWKKTSRIRAKETSRGQVLGKRGLKKTNY